MLILPAIDLRGGKCVRLTQGDYSREQVYRADPAAVAREFEIQGAQFLHIVDLDGAKQGRPVNLDSVRAIRNVVSIPMELGGGVRSPESARDVLSLGVDRVIVGTKLVQDPDLSARMFEEFGEKLVAGIDARDRKVSVSGWLESSELDAVSLAEELSRRGAGRFIVTDIATDGALTGPNLPFLSEFLTRVSGRIIASGGVSSLADLAALADLGPRHLEGAIVGKAIYENRFTLAEALHATSATKESG